MSILKPGVPVGLASDHAGYELKQFVASWLTDRGIPYRDFGTYSTESCDYPDFAHPWPLPLKKASAIPEWRFVEVAMVLTLL